MNEFTPQQYILGIRCVLTQRGHRHLHIEHSTFGDPDDIPRVGRSVGTPLPLYAVTVVADEDADSVAVFGQAADGSLWTMLLDGRQNEDYKALFETVYHWDNTPDDPEPEEWLADILDEDNALLRDLLREGVILPDKRIPVGVSFNGVRATLVSASRQEYRRSKSPNEERCAEEYIYALVTTDGKPVVHEISNYGWGTNHRKCTPGTLEDIAATLPQDNLLPVFLKWLTDKDIRPVSVCLTSVYWQDPQDWN